MKKLIIVLFIVLIAPACKVSYSFDGANINYNLTKTIEIRDFLNQAPLVYPPLTQTFNERMKDVFVQNTKLTLSDVNPDMEIEGEIVRYDLTPQSVKADAYESETRLTMAVKFRFRNNKEPQKDKEETISAYRDYSASLMLNDVQDQLIEELTKEIVDQIFNSTMSDW